MHSNRGSGIMVRVFLLIFTAGGGLQHCADFSKFLFLSILGYNRMSDLSCVDTNTSQHAHATGNLLVTIIYGGTKNLCGSSRLSLFLAGKHR